MNSALIIKEFKFRHYEVHIEVLKEIKDSKKG